MALRASMGPKRSHALASEAPKRLTRLFFHPKSAMLEIERSGLEANIEERSSSSW
jgi:hypothetical protein